MRTDERASLLASLNAAALAARGNNGELETMDADNRRWRVEPALVGVHANILIQVSRGAVTREAYLPTDTFTPGRAEAAITELDGALS